MANGKQREKEARGQKHSLISKELSLLWYYHTHRVARTMPHLLSLQVKIPICQSACAYGLGPRIQLITSPLARSVTDSARQTFPESLLCSLLILSIIWLTSALCRCSGGSETNTYQTLAMHRKKLPLPYAVFQLFSLHVTLTAKSRKHLQSLLLASKNAPQGQICRVKKVPFLLTFVLQTGIKQVRRSTEERGNSAGKKDIFCVV